VEVLLRKILAELVKSNKQLREIKELLVQQDEEPEDEEENDTYKTL